MKNAAPAPAVAARATRTAADEMPDEEPPPDEEPLLSGDPAAVAPAKAAVDVPEGVAPESSWAVAEGVVEAVASSELVALARGAGGGGGTAPGPVVAVGAVVRAAVGTAVGAAVWAKVGIGVAAAPTYVRNEKSPMQAVV